MADNQGVWGIEIGQAGLKAIRLRYAEAAEQVLAVDFDYIPHPKILSQPDAVPAELIPQALGKFLENNDIKGDKLVISVPGQTALARFIQLPPVPAQKVPEIVKFEARQQIPFALEDVIWDYQVLSVGSEEADFMLDAEVGLFAMKREEVLKQLLPFNVAKVEVDQIQIAPLGLYNVLYYDQMGIRKDDEEQSKDEHYIILDMGADNTTLVVTNGAKIWIRNVPVGGNHFTRALTKEMKLTFAKAEHLKCNATKSPDPRAVFKALQPVFNDYVAEIQRSIGYFSSVNRSAKIKKMVGVGNGFKLAGLQKFLQQNLTQFEVERLSSYKGLVGDNVLNAALFEENLLTFTVPYGLALQGLELTKVHTSLLPPEIATARKIREKKPWAAATAAAMLLGVTLSAVGYANVQRSVQNEEWTKTEQEVGSFNGKVDQFNQEYETRKNKHDEIIKTGRVVIDQLNARENWLEIYKAVEECLPRDTGLQNEDNILLQNRMKIQNITVQKLDEASLVAWYNQIDESVWASMRPEDLKPPTGPGYLFKLQGLHYHHDESDPLKGQADVYVKHTLLKYLQQWYSPNWTGQPPAQSIYETPTHGVRQLGITHAVLSQADNKPKYYLYSPDLRQQRILNGQSPETGANGEADGTNPMPMLTEGTTEENGPKALEIPRTTFTVEFIWQPVSEQKREVHNIMMNLMAPDELRVLSPNDPSVPDIQKSAPKLEEVTFEMVSEAVAKRNETIAAQNAEILENNRSIIAAGEDESQLTHTRELLTITSEEFDAFKEKYLVPGTDETKPGKVLTETTESEY